MSILDSSYWNNQYINHRTGWDIGYASPPIIEYFKQVNDKDTKILIPGAGNAWEAEQLWKMGFMNVYVLDFSEKALQNFRNRVPDFPKQNLILEDFFEHLGQYNYIVEQTFFSSLELSRRQEYVQKTFELLTSNGKLIGLLFNHQFSFNGPPFGGFLEDYITLFQHHFQILKLEKAYNSIKPRFGREFFINLTKK